MAKKNKTNETPANQTLAEVITKEQQKEVTNIPCESVATVVFPTLVETNVRVQVKPVECHGEADGVAFTVEEAPRFERDGNGLLEGVDYKYHKNGRIDWQEMFNPEYFIYPDDDKTRDPLLKVDGLRDLAELRGVEIKTVEFIPVSERFVTCKVKMKFIPNFENPEGRVWEAVADATVDNIGTGFAKYLSAMAETRATGRCIREALGIRLCTFEEVDPNDVHEEANRGPISDETIAGLKRQMELKGVNESTIMDQIHEKHPDINNFSELTQEQGQILLHWINKKTNIKS